MVPLLLDEGLGVQWATFRQTETGTSRFKFRFVNPPFRSAANAKWLPSYHERSLFSGVIEDPCGDEVNLVGDGVSGPVFVGVECETLQTQSQQVAGIDRAMIGE